MDTALSRPTQFKNNFSRALINNDIPISALICGHGPKIRACDIDSGQLCHFFQTTDLIHMTMQTVHKYQKQYNLFLYVICI